MIRRLTAEMSSLKFEIGTHGFDFLKIHMNCKYKQIL